MILIARGSFSNGFTPLFMDHFDFELSRSRSRVTCDSLDSDGNCSDFEFDSKLAHANGLFQMILVMDRLGYV